MVSRTPISNLSGNLRTCLGKVICLQRIRDLLIMEIMTIIQPVIILLLQKPNQTNLLFYTVQLSFKSKNRLKQMNFNLFLQHL